MAKQNQYSLSWFKKRTAQINKELRVVAQYSHKKGARIGFYSPTVEYQRYQLYKDSGGTEFVKLYGKTGDFRSAAGRAAVSAGESADIRRVWHKFADRNKIARAILDWLGTPDVVVNEKTGRIYRVEIDKDGKKHYTRLLDHGKTEALKGRPPANLTPLDNTSASRALANKAKEVKKRKDTGGGGGANGEYQNV